MTTTEGAEVWTFLAEVRRRRRRDRRGKIAYALYLAGLLIAIYGGPLIVRAVRSVEGAPHPTGGTHRLIAALPAALSATWLLVLLALARQAVWRGPVLLSAADANWLLPTPLPRSRLLGPRWRRSLVTAIVVAAGIGAVGALILHGYSVARLDRLWLPTIGATVLVGALGLAVAALIVRFEGAARIVATLSPYVAALVVGIAAVAVARASGAHLGWLEDGILWSGPWGWSAQLVVQGFAPGATTTFWPVAGGLVAVTTGAAVVLAWAESPHIAAKELRRRAATAAAVSAAVFLGETRDARLGIRAGRNAGLARRRLPMPTRPALTLPWRDATALLRAPAAIAWAMVALGVAAVAVRTAVGHHSARHGVVPIAIAMVAAYVAAAQLVEPARLDADDVRRTRWSPYGPAGLARRHAVVPLLLVTLAGLAGVLGGAAWLDGTQVFLAVVAVVAFAPSLIGATLIGAYRGRVPLELMFSGIDIGFGSFGPLLLITWYLYGPLAAIGVGELTLAMLVYAWHHTGFVAGSSIGAVIVGATAAGLLYRWVGKRARDLTLSAR